MSKIYGLYLAGGQSTRMGSPKWALTHADGTSFLDYAVAQLGVVCEEVFISVATQNPEISYPQICDDALGTTNLGPLGGLLAAHMYDPEASWLLLACDLPAMSAEHLVPLVAGEGEIVAYRNPIDGVAEATATLYRPAALRALKAHLTEGSNHCMRHFLDTQNTTVLPAPSYYALQNVNYPADYSEFLARAKEGFCTPEVNVTLDYYAKLKQDAGSGQVTLTTRSVTIAGLWEECRFRHNLSLRLPSVKPAANNAFVDWDYQLQDGDLIAFMPPFAGG